MDLLEGLFKHYWHRTTELKSEVGELTQKLAAMEDYLERKKKEILDYGEQVAQTFKKRDEMEAALREEMSARRAHDQRLIEEKNSQLSALDVQHRQLQDEHNAERTSMRDQISHLKKDLHTGRDELGKAKVSVTEKDNTLQLVREELEDAQSAFQRDLGARNQAIDKFKDTIRKQRSNIAQSETDQTDLREQLKSFEGELKQQRVTHALELQQENERLASLQQDLVTTRAVRDGLDAESETLREELSSVQLELSGVQSDKEHLETRLGQSEQRVSEWMEANEDMKGQITQLQSDISDLREERTLLEQDHGRLIVAKEETEVGFVQREQSLRSDIEKLEDQVDSVNAELANSKQVFETLEAEHSELLVDSKEAASSLSNNIEERDEAIEKLKSSMETGRQETARLERETQTLREALETERSESLARRVSMVEKVGLAKQVLQSAQHREGL
jgi:chromosome segregation protein